MTVQPGAFVRHTAQPSWGTGRVLELIGSDKVRIRFLGAGEKLLSLQAACLEPAMPSASEKLVLEGPGPRPRPKKPAKLHDELVAAFLRSFPGGFASPEYWRQEREYKVRAHEFALEHLAEQRVRDLLASGHFETLAITALRVMEKTNLVFPNEKMALGEAVKNPGSAEPFSRLLVDLLYGGGSLQRRFEAFADFLVQVDAARWTVATYFPFICFPREHMFLKPGVTQKAAEAYGFWLAYDPHLNWRTYEQLLAFAQMLQERLAPLEPVDMLDVQSFLWVAGTQD